MIILKECILYARKSPTVNTDSKSIDAQLHSLRIWARENGYEIVGEFIDEWESGGDADRQGLNTAIATLKRGQALVVDQFSRLSRDVMHALQFEFAIESRGCFLISTEVPIEQCVGKDPSYKLFRTMLHAVNEYQREINSQLTSKRMLIYQKEGRVVGGNPAFGWQRDPMDRKKLIKNEYEQHLLQDIIIPLWKKNYPKISISALCAALQAAGIKNPRTQRLKWWPNTMSHILKREGIREPEGGVWTKGSSPSGFPFAQIKASLVGQIKAVYRRLDLEAEQLKTRSEIERSSIRIQKRQPDNH